MIRSLFTAITVFFLPSSLVGPVLRLAGHKVARGAKIGFSIVLVDKLYMEPGSTIGHLNFLRCRRIVMRTGAYIQHLNVVKGPISVSLAKRGAIGNRNIIKRASEPVTYGPAQFRLGELSKITASHVVDCTRSVIMGDFSILAGLDSQLWTHGYYHFPEGPNRFRVDGPIIIGHNVYIGSACVIGAGVRIANRVVVGSHSSVSKSLEKPGMYVSQPLRYIEMDIDDTLDKLEPVTKTCCEKVYIKKARQ